MITGVFLADTHLGIDWPMRPRVERRRRGDDFFKNYLSVLGQAVDSGAQFILHGGDLFYRSKVPAGLVARVFEPLLEVADLGIGIYIVPGNHERSRIPASLFASHPNIHIFDKPRSFVLEQDGVTVEMTGFPSRGRGIRETFAAFAGELKETWNTDSPDIRLLCIHEIVEGARVGPSDYQFKSGTDVIRCRDLPSDYDAVLSGHIHRHQVLRTDPAGQAISPAVYYPGSIERTSFAERDEEKGFLELKLIPGVQAEWIRLPARPMVTLQVDLHAMAASKHPGNYLAGKISEIDPDAVVRMRLSEDPPEELLPYLSGPYLREIAPRTMNIQLTPGGQRR